MRAGISKLHSSLSSAGSSWAVARLDGLQSLSSTGRCTYGSGPGPRLYNQVTQLQGRYVGGTSLLLLLRLE